MVAQQLLQRGQAVRVIGRSADRLRGLTAQGAEAAVAEFHDAERLASAFTGAEAAFVMIPPDHVTPDHLAYQDRVGQATAQALKTAGVRYVVNLSSVGAHLAEGSGPIRGLRRQELRLNELAPLTVLHLRPAYFMENLLWGIPAIRAMGVNGSPLSGDLPIPMVATRDIGLKAAELLAALTFTGRTVFEFFGPRAVTLVEATRILGKAIGRPDLRYVPFGYDEAQKAMSSSGISPDYARLLIEMNRSFNEGRILPTQPMTGEHAGRTTVEQFAESFAAAYRSAA
jgi:uncharacterized protein YbjT (DUF2867 family)